MEQLHNFQILKYINNWKIHSFILRWKTRIIPPLPYKISFSLLNESNIISNTKKYILFITQVTCYYTPVKVRISIPLVYTHLTKNPFSRSVRRFSCIFRKLSEEFIITCLNLLFLDELILYLVKKSYKCNDLFYYSAALCLEFFVYRR